MSRLLQQLNNLQKAEYFECLIPGATLIMEESQSIVHVITGNLRDSHNIQQEDEVVRIQVDADYAAIEEFGSDTREAHPYLRPAIDNKKREASEAIADAINKKMKEAV